MLRPPTVLQPEEGIYRLPCRASLPLTTFRPLSAVHRGSAPHGGARCRSRVQLQDRRVRKAFLIEENQSIEACKTSRKAGEEGDRQRDQGKEQAHVDTAALRGVHLPGASRVSSLCVYFT